MTAPGPLGGRPVLVTGGAGFIGCNLADRLARDGHEVLVYDALARPGVEANLAWLQARHPRRVSAVVADIRDERELGRAAAEAGAVFHLAAQVAVTTSMVDPRDDFAVNLGGTFALLEALRRRRASRCRSSSPAPTRSTATWPTWRWTREGDAYGPRDPAVRAHGIGEDRPLDFHTPYGCSKGAADQYVLDYARSFGLPTAVLRMSCIYGPRQMGTEDQGWIAHFLIRALRGEPISVYGDGCQVRDALDVGDAVEAYLAAWARIGAVKGRAFNLGGGPRQRGEPAAGDRLHRRDHRPPGGRALRRLARRRPALLRLRHAPRRAGAGPAAAPGPGARASRRSRAGCGSSAPSPPPVPARRRRLQ